MGRLKKDQVWGKEIQKFGSGDVISDIPISQSLKQRPTLVSMSCNCSRQSVNHYNRLRAWAAGSAFFSGQIICYTISYAVSYTCTLLYADIKAGIADKTIELQSLKLVRAPSLFCSKRQLTQQPTPKSTLQSQDYLVITVEQYQDPLAQIMVLQFLF